MVKSQLIASCKLACRVSSNKIDDEVSELIDAAFLDLEISGVADVTGQPYTIESADQLVITAVKTYVKLNMGDVLDNAEAERLTRSYDNQKAQLTMRNHSSSVITGDES